jgi:hypothetical protein
MKLYDKIKKYWEDFCYVVSGKINKSRDTSIKEQAEIILGKTETIQGLEQRLKDNEGLLEQKAKKVEDLEKLTTTLYQDKKNLELHTAECDKQMADHETLYSIAVEDKKKAEKQYRDLQSEVFSYKDSEKCFSGLSERDRTLFKTNLPPPITEVLPHHKIKMPNHDKPDRTQEMVKKLSHIPYITEIRVETKLTCKQSYVKGIEKDKIHIIYSRNSQGINFCITTTAQSYFQNGFICALIEKCLKIR